MSSNQIEQLAYHIHAHLAIYVNGAQKTVPYGIGIEQPWSTQADGSSEFVNSGAAFYYLHTHDDTGVIHIESPNRRSTPSASSSPSGTSRCPAPRSARTRAR